MPVKLHPPSFLAKCLMPLSLWTMTQALLMRTTRRTSTRSLRLVSPLPLLLSRHPHPLLLTCLINGWLTLRAQLAAFRYVFTEFYPPSRLSVFGVTVKGSGKIRVHVGLVSCQGCFGEFMHYTHMICSLGRRSASVVCYLLVGCISSSDANSCFRYT
jgi:hypothetical protein